ncbi:hypothetical protein K9K77_00670 [Candidatus Babeliales bacterium]|nr:hypothetical protein [Candidatus Babeliales bacterium]
MDRGILGVSKRYSILAPFLFFIQLGAHDYREFASETLLRQDGVIDSVFFTQQEKETIEKTLVGLIQSEEQRISGALFRLSNKKITQALLEAHERGVSIEIVFDAGAIGPQIFELTEAGVPLFVYDNKRFPALMHHKFLLFHCVLGQRSILSTGSLNLTEAGFAANAENVTMRNNNEWVTKFYAEFIRLRDKSQHLVSIKYQDTIEQESHCKHTIIPCHQDLVKKSGKKRQKRKDQIRQLLLSKQAERIVRFTRYIK